MKMRLQDFLDAHMKRGGHFIPARLQAALALLEKLRDDPSLKVGDHLASKGSAGLQSHETYGKRAHERFGIEPMNKNHGRRSSSLQDWGQELLDQIEAQGFETASQGERDVILHTAQEALASTLKRISEQEPLEVRVRERTAEAILGDVLKQADEKNKAGDVAQYLVGAKLMLRFDREMPILPANKGDRKSRRDADPRQGDFEVGNAVVEVAVGLPDEKHLDQVAQILDSPGAEVWLLTRADRVETWRKAVDSAREVDGARVVVSSVEAFIGQNITELGEFSTVHRTGKLKALFDLYNERWVKAVGHPGIRIVVK